MLQLVLTSKCRNGLIPGLGQREVHGVSFQLPILLRDLRQGHALCLELTLETVPGPLREPQSGPTFQTHVFPPSRAPPPVGFPV